MIKGFNLTAILFTAINSFDKEVNLFYDICHMAILFFPVWGLTIILVAGLITWICLFQIFPSLKELPNFHRINSKLFRSGIPTKEGFNKLRKMGIKTIVCLLRRERRAIVLEKEIAERLGIDFVHIPMTGRRRPEDDSVKNFLKIVTDTDRQPTLIHCKSGRDRTGAMVAIYRVVCEGWSPRQAYTEAKRYGFRWFYLPLRRLILKEAERFKNGRFRIIE